MWRQSLQQVGNQSRRYRGKCPTSLHRTSLPSLPSLPTLRSFANEAPSNQNEPRIQARPQGEAEFKSKFPLPDKDKERELGAMQNEMQDIYKAGNYRLALKSAEKLLKATEDHFGTEHPATASAYNNVGLMHKLQGEFNSSRSNYQSALKIYKQTVGADHASYASILHNLGNLNRSQIHFDSSLKATDRLSLIESAVDYLQNAFLVRKAELGEDHPHTVASKSSWGATLSAQILHHYKMTSPSTDPANKRVYRPTVAESVTKQGWEAAEFHLRQALTTAVEKPRGPSLNKKNARKTKSKKQRQPDTIKDGVQTLSAASAAQNLAVFLKSRATTETPYNQGWLDEAYKLYQDVLRVRQQLLPATHPDLYASKHSLAELLGVMGDEEAANSLRQDIVDTYDPPEDKGAEVEMVQKSNNKNT